jgi:hypothetical protein
MVTQYIEVPIVRADLVEDFVRAVPMIQNFLDQVFTVPELKPHRSLVRLPAGIALYS